MAVPAAAIVGGLAFAFGGFLTSYPMQSMSILETAVWLPLLLYLVERGTRAGAVGCWVLAGAAMACAILAGHPQTALYVAYTVAAYMFYRHLVAPKPAPSESPPLLQRAALLFARLVTVFSIGLGLAAVQLIPTAEFYLQSNRIGLSYEVAAVGYSADSLLAVVLPDWNQVHAPYVGVTTFVLAAWACLRLRTSIRFFWLGLAVVGALLALGGNGPLYPLFHRFVPGFDLFQHQERAMVLFALGMAVLAGLGWADIARARRADSEARRHFWAAPAVAALAALAVTCRSLGLPNGEQAQFAYVVAFGVATSWLAVSSRRATVSARAGAVLAIGLVLVDLFTVNHSPNLAERAAWPTPAMLAARTIIAADDPSDGWPVHRVRVQTDDEDAFPPNYGHLTALPQLGGDSPWYQQRLADLWEAQQEWRLWELTNVKYTLSRRELGAGLDFLGWAGDLRVYRMQWPIPRIWATRDVRVVASPEESLRLTFSPDTPPGRVAVVEEDPRLGFATAEPPEQSHELIEHQGGRMLFRTELSHDALVVVSEAYYPGWRALVDGRPAPVYRSNYYLRAVPVPAGEHLVEFRFEPTAFALGTTFSLVFLAACLLALLGSGLVARLGAGRSPPAGR